MKRIVKKVTLASVFACALAAASLGVVNYNVASAEVATDPTKITMVEKASLRLEHMVDDVQIPFGLRFKTQVNKAWYDGLVAEGKTPQVYTVLLPTDMLGEAELTDATTGIALADIDEDKKYVVGENYVFNTVLTGMDEEAEYCREISVRSYIVVDDQTTIYTPLATGSYASTARSVVTVADKALTEDSEAYGAVDKYLITGVNVPDNRYLAVEKESNVSASIVYAAGTSEAVQTILNEKYPFTYTSNAEETVTVGEDGTLTAVAAGMAEITVKNEALGVEKKITVTTYEAAAPVYGVMSFDNLDMVEDVKAYRGAQNLQLVDDNGETKISYYHNGKDQTSVGFTLAKPAWIENFDTMTITIAMTEETDPAAPEVGQAWTTYGISSGTHELLLSYEGSSYQFRRENDVITYTFNPANTEGEWNNENDFLFYMERRYTYKGESATFVIGAPKFGINDIAYTSGDEAINLYEKFHTEEGKATFKFTATGATEGTTIENPTAYAGTQDGVITATIKMDGYADGTVTANYDNTDNDNTDDDTTNLLPYGTVLDFTNIDESKLTAYNTANPNIEIVEYNEKQAIKVTATHTADEATSSSNEYTGVKVTLPDYYSKFTSFSATIVLAEETETIDDTYKTTARWTVYGNTNYQVKDVGNSVTWSSTYDKRVDKGVLSFYIQLRDKGAQVSATFYITEIKLGFADITAGSEFSWETYGLAASELTNVTFKGETVDASNFAPTEAGTLTFTVNKAGYAPATFSINVVAAS